VQLRFATQGTTGEDYVSSRLWERARLEVCPLHPQLGCGFASHGTYKRARPAGTRIRRWYCPTGQVTFSALPDCLSARLSGELAEVERVVRRVQAAPSLSAAVRQQRLEIGLAGVLRYVGRRLNAIARALRAIKGLYPERFGTAAATVTAFAYALEHTGNAAPVLQELREVAARHLGRLPAPLGFAAARISPRQPRSACQHWMGADPPVVVLDPRERLGQPP